METPLSCVTFPMSPVSRMEDRYTGKGLPWQDVVSAAQDRGAVRPSACGENKSQKSGKGPGGEWTGRLGNQWCRLQENWEVTGVEVGVESRLVWGSQGEGDVR